MVTHGWRTALAIEPPDVFCDAGLAVCLTDVDREGTMTGVNLKSFRALRDATNLPIVTATVLTTTHESAR